MKIGWVVRFTQRPPRTYNFQWRYINRFDPNGTPRSVAESEAARVFPTRAEAEAASTRARYDWGQAITQVRARRIP